MSGPIQNNRINDLLAGQIAPAKPAVQQVDIGQKDAFQSILQNRLKVSSHAQTRLQSRDIQLEAKDWDRVLEGIDKAAAKGAKESLVMLDDVALVVSIKNRTVITAVDREHLKNNVFTNIDSAVIV